MDGQVNEVPAWAKPGLTYVEVQAAIIAEVGMMANARTPEMSRAYRAAVERYLNEMYLLNIKVCARCTVDPDPRGWSACYSCRELNHGMKVVEPIVRETSNVGSVAIVTDDPVNPKHYKGDLVMRIIEHFGLDDSFPIGNCLKYILRHRDKNGVEDLLKAKWYLERAIAKYQGKLAGPGEAVK